MLIIPCIQRIKNLISPRTLTRFSFFYFISPILSQNKLFILSQGKLSIRIWSKQFLLPTRLKKERWSNCQRNKKRSQKCDKNRNRNICQKFSHHSWQTHQRKEYNNSCRSPRNQWILIGFYWKKGSIKWFIPKLDKLARSLNYYRRCIYRNSKTNNQWKICQKVHRIPKEIQHKKGNKERKWNRNCRDKRLHTSNKHWHNHKYNSQGRNHIHRQVTIILTNILSEIVSIKISNIMINLLFHLFFNTLLCLHSSRQNTRTWLLLKHNIHSYFPNISLRFISNSQIRSISIHLLDTCNIF